MLCIQITKDIWQSTTHIGRIQLSLWACYTKYSKRSRICPFEDMPSYHMRICPSQHFPSILTHQGASWSVSPKHGQYLLLTDQQSPSSSEMLCPFPNYCHSPRYVLWETPFSTIQGSSPCSNRRITFGLENRIPVHEQEREWIHGADMSGQSLTQIQPQSLWQRTVESK